MEFIALVRVPVTARSASRGTASKCPGPTAEKVSQLISDDDSPNDVTSHYVYHLTLAVTSNDVPPDQTR